MTDQLEKVRLAEDRFVQDLIEADYENEELQEIEVGV